MNLLRGYKKDDEDCKCEVAIAIGYNMTTRLFPYSGGQPLPPFGEERCLTGGMCRNSLISFRRIYNIIYLQARTFNDNMISARKCSIILTKVLYLLNHVGIP